MADKDRDAKAWSRELASNPSVLVQRKGSPDDERFRGLLYGNLGDEVLMMGGFQNESLEIGDELLVRLVREAHLIGFETTVLRKLDDPELYLLRFPETVEALGLRRNERISAFFPADVHVAREVAGDKGFLDLKTRIIDISAGGCSFRSKTELPKDTELKISFSLPGDRHIQSASAVVIESKRSGGTFTNRARFPQGGANITIMQDIAKWIAENAAFASD